MDVIVIGCGAAGVAALRKLHDAGLKVMGLEAADRIGGRICTVEFGANAVDIGAAWCHGEKDNIVFELANPHELLGKSDPGQSWFVQSDGQLISEDIGEKISSAIAEEVGKADKKTMKGIAEYVKSAAATNAILKEHPLTNSFIESYERMNHLGGQDDASKGKSLRGLEEHWPCEGEFMLNWKGKGYKMILDVLLNKYPDPSKAVPVQILLNKEVENIRWGSRRNSQSAGLETASPLVQVKCRDGSLYIAKSVIVTLSIGVLQERHIQLFNPPLPSNKVTTINNLQMAVLDKIYIEFTKPWWPKTPGSFVILWREQDKAQFTSEEKWITDIFALDTVAHQPNLLLAWMYGNGAGEMEKVSLAGVHAGVDKLLKTVLKKFDVAPIKTVVRSQWASNPLARGAYAYRSVATEQNGGDGAILLSEPLYHCDEIPVVCFAGEATSHHRNSAVHGAVESGFREADRLIDSFKKFKL